MCMRFITPLCGGRSVVSQNHNHHFTNDPIRIENTIDNRNPPSRQEDYHKYFFTVNPTDGALIVNMCKELALHSYVL